jgi:hypothetical protein
MKFEISHFILHSQILPMSRTDQSPCWIMHGECWPSPLERLSGEAIALRLFRANNRTAIHFVRYNESDFGVGSGRRVLDLFVGEELVRRESLVEDDEDL